MSQHNHLSTIAEVFGEVTDLGGVEFHEGIVLGDDLMVSSAEVLQIISRIQNRFRVRFEPMEIISIKTVGDIARLVEKHQS